MLSKESCWECKGELTAEQISDAVVSLQVADEINEHYNSGNNHLTCIKVFINPMYHKANIYAGYEDTSRILESGSEDTMATLCEAYIEWSDMESEENTVESWKDFSYPMRQMERALLLAERFNMQPIVLCCSDNLKCEIKNGKAHIDRI
jgi:hypothetical protein